MNKTVNELLEEGADMERSRLWDPLAHRLVFELMHQVSGSYAPHMRSVDTVVDPPVRYVDNKWVITGEGE